MGLDVIGLRDVIKAFLFLDKVGHDLEVQDVCQLVPFPIGPHKGRIFELDTFLHFLVVVVQIPDGGRGVRDGTLPIFFDKIRNFTLRGGGGIFV